MKYALFINLFILLLVAIGGGVLIYTLQSSPAPASLPVVHNSQRIRQSETDVLSVDVTYPVFNESLKGAREANGAIAQELDLAISQFEKQASSSLEDPIDLPEDVKSSVDGGYVVEYENDRLISILFTAEWYMRGTAHPFHTLHTYIFDKEVGKLVTVQDLFKPYSHYFDFLSSYAYNDLIQQLKEGDTDFVYVEQILKSGTEATLENFSHVLPTKDGLMLYFDEYQVAPYSAGPQVVVIPYEKLSGVINKEGILGTYIK